MVPTSIPGGVAYSIENFEYRIFGPQATHVCSTGGASHGRRVPSYVRCTCPLPSAVGVHVHGSVGDGVIEN